MANDQQFSLDKYGSKKLPQSDPIDVPSIRRNRFEIDLYDDDDDDDREEKMTFSFRQSSERLSLRKKTSLIRRPQSVPIIQNMACVSSAMALNDDDEPAENQIEEVRPRRHSLATEIEIGRELQSISDRFLVDFKVTRSSSSGESPASRLRQWWAAKSLSAAINYCYVSNQSPCHDLFSIRKWNPHKLDVFINL
ncbi:uncharacterized protein TRIADDRAFT_61373 [Trichoplax adhaerens]|uniref:Uncharacterized protein n=1 Tax=Trichoplax adhaerens TaxID=10228 RepID=B3SAT5_TRIAD|nr:predicted protein [Trichoplax adhaerens]EDV20208.1 predicted protein [Trichoplax adhaerens]|eukprot:XP_002117369.1 predicted protein [Trichoplax adhaerens]